MGRDNQGSGGPPRRTHHAALPDAVRQRMEGSFGADFSTVRVHAASPVVPLGARAMTQGHDIHFGPGQYAPGSPAGQKLLAHELAHVVQQRQGGLAPQRPEGLAEAEAQLASHAAAAGQAAPLHVPSNPGAEVESNAAAIERYASAQSPSGYGYGAGGDGLFYRE